MKHNFLRRLGALLLVFALALPMAVTTAWAADDFSVSLNKTALELKNRGTADLTAIASNVPAGYSVTYEWSSDNTGVATVKGNGSTATVTAAGTTGSAVITVTATCTPSNPSSPPIAPVTAQCEVNVEVTLTSLSLKEWPDKPMRTGETRLLELVFSPTNATDKTVTWSVHPAGIVEIDGTPDGTCRVTALKEGKTTVTARGTGSNYNVYLTIPVNVENIPVLEVAPKQADIPASLLIGETFKLTANVTPVNSGIEWKSSNTSVAAVDSTGLVTCLKTGTVTITCTATDPVNGSKKVSDTRKITVADPNSMFANSLSVKGSSEITLSAGEEYQLAVSVSPSTAQVTWISENPAVAEVELTTGVVKGVSPGKAKITASSPKADGTRLTAEFEVTVMGKATGIAFNYPDPAKFIYFDSKSGRKATRFDASGALSRTLYVTVSSVGNLPTNTYVVFTSSDTSIVTVNSRGASGVDLTINSKRSAGQATVTATLYDNTTKKPIMNGKDPMSDELDVVISGISLSDSSLLMYEGESKTLNIDGRFGEADTGDYGGITWTSSDPSIASPEGSGAGATINAWTKGTATITASKGNYSATCTVTVVEDPGTVVKAGSTAAGNAIKLGTSSVISQINAIAKERTKSNMEYITSIFISPDQGVVYNTYTSEADTGAGVSMAEKYYVNRSIPATEYIGALSFVPNKSFSGEARIAYIGYSNGQSISGIISVNVSGMGEAGADVAYTSTAAPVTFLAEDFNIICTNKTGHSLKYVTFTPPAASVGALYENYISADHPGQQVLASTQYYRTGTPNLSGVTFVPADGYSGTVKIGYRAVDNSNNGYSGTVTITVNKGASSSDPADISYTAPQDGWVTFRAADFANASLRVIGETLSHVRFALPPSSNGTLYYNYRGYGDYDSDVDSTTDYYYSGTPALGSVTFVPATTTERRAAIHYTGYSTRGTTFTGTVYITESGYYQSGTDVHYDYTVNCGSSVYLNASDFNAACLSATGAGLDYISFSSLPDAKQGTLRYQKDVGSSFTSVSTSDQFHRVGSSTATPLIGNVSFLAGPSFTGTVNIPYVAWNTEGTPYQGKITIQVTPNTIVYTGTTANPIGLSSAHIADAVRDTLRNPLSYIEFTSLPTTPGGHVYLNYSGYGTGTRANTGVKYSASGSPGINQLSFVPVGRFTGDTTAEYTAYSTTGETMSGQITFRISAPNGSRYFTDLNSYSWAASSVDYLYQNRVTNGMSATTYGPSLQIRRADFILMLHRIFDYGAGSTTNTGFADVPGSAYYAQAVSAAKQRGIINGDGVNFMPNSPITRQDAMVMVYNTMKATGKYQGNPSTSTLNNFPDGSSVADYARDAVSALVQMGAVNGSNGMLNPRTSITRAEAAVILHFIMTA